MKKISVIVRNLPLNTRRNAEALRMSVGLTLREDKVTVIFMDDGIFSAIRMNPERINFPSLEREFGALKMMKCTLLVDKPSMDKRGVKNFSDDIKTADRDEIVRIMNESDIIIPF